MSRRPRHEWTTTEDRQLREMHHAGVLFKVICSTLDRAETTVIKRARLLSLPLRHRGPRPAAYRYATMHVCLPPELLERVKEKASASGQTVSEHIRRVLRETV